MIGSSGGLRKGNGSCRREVPVLFRYLLKLTD